MKILVISDTHGNIDRLNSILKKTGPYDALFHCGDIEVDVMMPVYLDHSKGRLPADLPGVIQRPRVQKRQSTTGVKKRLVCVPEKADVCISACRLFSYH